MSDFVSRFMILQLSHQILQLGIKPIDFKKTPVTLDIINKY